MAGIEPATDGLRNRCSTAELHWLKTIENKAFFAFISTGVLGACILNILNLHTACFLCYEDQHTIGHQAQSGLGLGQNPRIPICSATNPAAHILGAFESMAS